MSGEVIAFPEETYHLGNAAMKACRLAKCETTWVVKQANFMAIEVAAINLSY